VEHNDHPEHKDHHKPLLLQWHLQFFFVNNDVCLVEHEEHPKEVLLLLQWHLQLLLAYIEECLFRTCSFSSDQVVFRTWISPVMWGIMITTTIAILTTSGSS
jgi:hypothetical protein